VQQRPDQHERPAHEQDGAGRAMVPSGDHLRPAHHQLPHLLQLDQKRRVVRGDVRQRQRSET
ncbi:hypothetical protein M9458_024128, partial [Cirrhinus mrigala]